MTEHKSLIGVAGFSVLAAMTLTTLTSSAQAAIWGVKSHDQLSQPPATLFSLDDNGQNISVVAPVTLGGQQIDVDGLAQDSSGKLFGFQVASGATGAWSRLITINTSTAEATVVGATLTGFDVRGATFTEDGQLLALDADNNVLLRVDPATGNTVLPAALLTLGGLPYNLSTVTDLTQEMDGSIVVAVGAPSGSSFYDLNTGTGALDLLHTDLADGLDGQPVGLAGIATSPNGDNPEQLTAYDVTWDDDIFHYDPTNGWARTNGPLAIINSYNAGRGDLAGPVVPEPATLCLLALGGLAAINRRRRK